MPIYEISYDTHDNTWAIREPDGGALLNSVTRYQYKYFHGELFTVCLERDNADIALNDADEMFTMEMVKLADRTTFKAPGLNLKLGAIVTIEGVKFTVVDVAYSEVKLKRRDK